MFMMDKFQQKKYNQSLGNALGLQQGIWWKQLNRSSTQDEYIQGVKETKKSGPYKDFVKSKNTVNFLSKPYIEDQVLRHSGFAPVDGKRLFAKETESTNFLYELLQLRPTLFTQWPNFKRKAKKIQFEQLICVVKGTEKFKLVSPIYRQNIYVGMFENYKDHEVPVDFFKVDLEKYPFAKYVSFIDVELKTGDCLYVPAFFYVQSQTLAEESIIIT